jgi:hypothetical protein
MMLLLLLFVVTLCGSIDSDDLDTKSRTLYKHTHTVRDVCGSADALINHCVHQTAKLR